MAFFLGLAEANAYKLYTEFATLPLSHRAFRERLVFQMLGSLETQSTGTIPTTSEHQFCVYETAFKWNSTSERYQRSQSKS